MQPKQYLWSFREWREFWGWLAAITGKNWHYSGDELISPNEATLFDRTDDYVMSSTTHTGILKWGGPLDRDGDADFHHTFLYDGIKVSEAIKLWASAKHTIILTVEVDRYKEEDVRAAIKAAGGKIV